MTALFKNIQKFQIAVFTALIIDFLRIMGSSIEIYREEFVERKNESKRGKFGWKNGKKILMNRK